MRWLALLLVGCGTASTAPVDSGVSVDAGPKSNVAVVSVPDTNDFVPDGADWTVKTGDAIYDMAKDFFGTHGDDYDFLIMWSDFLVKNATAFTVTLKIDVGGIGLDVIDATFGGGKGRDSTARAGSKGRLQAICFLNGKKYYEGKRPPLDITVHEVGHRWGAYFAPALEPDPFFLLDGSRTHWSLVAGLGGFSAMGYGRTVDNGDGTFTTSVATKLDYAPWELYAMGLMPPEDLPDFFYVRNPTGFSPPNDGSGQPFSAKSIGGASTTFSGEKVSFTPQNMIAKLGPRVPSVASSQKSFRAAFLAVCPNRTCSKDTLDWVESLRAAWPARFSSATAGRGTMTTEL